MSRAFRCATRYPENHGKRQRESEQRQYDFLPQTKASEYFRVYWMHRRFAGD